MIGLHCLGGPGFSSRSVILSISCTCLISDACMIVRMNLGNAGIDPFIIFKSNSFEGYIIGYLN